ncbi:hydrolase TatD [Pandoraea horticolens]|uniref:Hydrolase TatD n=1 Tax=Pandoraea horticolens TaxID=2508298 RepID=A0A5E4V064_9BURK|nr:Qat anti-phage system TatD family nuclease QatD [Pandoraea horticolens]VVE04769.1 hydrolase TatD [Pandoraea horticolens]
MMDFHCHLDLYPSARTVYTESARRCEFVWLVTTSPKAFIATSRVLQPVPTIVISPGLHPEIAHQRHNELPLLLEEIGRASAVGEIGLDGSARYREHFPVQKAIFEATVARCSELGGRVLSIHSRSAAKEVLDTLERHSAHGTAVLHWFSDSSIQLKRAIELGCWFSIGPAMLRSANGLRLAALLPSERVVPESDGPFAKLAGQPIMPWEAMGVVGSLASLWNLTEEEVLAQLTENGRELRHLMTAISRQIAH